MLLTTDQPPIAKASQTSAWSYKYIGDWIRKTEGSPIGFIPFFLRLKSWKFPLAKVVDFEPLGALLGPGIPMWVLFGSDSANLKLLVSWISKNLIKKLYVHNADRIWRCHVQSMSTPKPLVFLAKMNQRTPCTLHVLSMYSTKTI